MTTPATTPATPTTGTRLPNGELRRLVAAYLAAAAPADEFTPRQIAAELNKSSGAVGNALASLAAGGFAEQSSPKPVRYRQTPTTITAVAAPARTAARPARARRAPASPAPTAPAPASHRVTGPVTRPNGQAYHPRQLSGTSDVAALRTLRDAGVSALMYGPPGTGKTSVVEAAFGDVITVAGDGDTTVADLVGEYTQTPDGRFIFVYGPLVRAMREGRALFLDDATLIAPTVLAVVYPAMDGRRQIIVKANGGEVVDAAPGFYVVAGHNPGVHGAVLSDALSSRFAVQIEVTSDYDLATQLGINPRAITVARNLATKQTQGEVGWAPQLRELIAFHKIAAVLGINAAAENLVGIAPEDDRDVVAGVVRAAFGKPVRPLALGARIK